MLDVPLLQKLNLKFSAWIMSRVDVHNRSIVLTDNKILKFWPQDVSKVFGIPHGPRNVIGRDATIRPDAIEFIKTTLGMNQAGAHSLKAAENFLTREITEDSSKIEKDCFQIAFVIFVMGHILAPSSKYDYATIDFWGALANTENIAQFNWGEYIIQSLLDAVDKYKRDVRNQAQTINLFGCHLWLQVSCFSFLYTFYLYVFYFFMYSIMDMPRMMTIGIPSRQSGSRNFQQETRRPTTD
jgi:hypothetical protein